jgi:hypothetical protein
MSKANTELVPYVMFAASLGIVALFAMQILLRREVEADPDEQEALQRAIAVSVLGDDIERNGSEAGLARPSAGRGAAAARPES